MSEQRSIAYFLAKLQTQLPYLQTHFGVAELWLFGSYVRGEEIIDSDLDVLVTFDKTPSLLTFIELENHIADFLGVKIDLVMREGLKPRIGERILSEVVQG